MDEYIWMTVDERKMGQYIRISEDEAFAIIVSRKIVRQFIYIHQS